MMELPECGIAGIEALGLVGALLVIVTPGTLEAITERRRKEEMDLAM
jgi:hypothetical protein